ncbi:MAG: ATP-binding cassette domain-containing protein [Bacilli bacterium]|nr:ATP-binding cassette domain-containing protein [Bacilli bacterium]
MLKISNLSYKYNKDSVALKDINLEIKPKEIVMVIGKNGAGKSTLYLVLPIFINMMELFI